MEVHNFSTFIIETTLTAPPLAQATMLPHQEPTRAPSYLNRISDDSFILKDASIKDRKRRKQVSFNRITIREYPIIIGDHPSVQGGPPLTISWEHVSSVDIDVDMYERARELSCRRERSEMKMPREYRQELLKSLGFTMLDMRQGSKAAVKTRNQRRQSNSHIYQDSLHESWEDLRRGVAQAVTLGMTRRKERLFLRRHVPSFGTNMAQ
jgi:hypothetical protein